MRGFIDKCKLIILHHPHIKDWCITVLLQAAAILLSSVFFYFVPEKSANIALIQILALILITKTTDGYFYGIFSAIVGVICVNYFFTYPYFALNFTLTGYPITFVCMLTISLITSTMTSHLKKQAVLLAEREKLLMEAEKEKMRANLLRAVSHDLRTPLTGIIGNSSAYIDNTNILDDSEKLKLVQRINDDSNWLLNMVENLLSVTRIRTNTMKVTTSLEAVEEVVGEAMSRFKKRLPDVPVQVTIPEEYIFIPIDAMLIEQVIINLLENAAVHANSESPIIFTVTDCPDTIQFSIRDFGIGIAEDRIDTIFDGSNYEASETSDARKGMGIGLSICKTIITAHRGNITARNHDDGAEFVFDLPKEEKIYAS
ncbi:MAG: DUF4118 domain-containing protein [Lachnospiraceae bacterium]|nr:DUF4118 domain-containing protein [Lachnospiraceae bacterium]